MVVILEYFFLFLHKIYLMGTQCNKTSMTRTPMVRLPWLMRTGFLSPFFEILRIAQYKGYFRECFFLFYQENVCCGYSLEAPWQQYMFLCRNGEIIPE